jgi:uncharacterized membrane protein YfcA
MKLDIATQLPWYMAYLVLGCIGGFSAGLLGIGGGMIYVPLMAMLFEAQGFPSKSLMHLALGTSLSTILFTSMSSLRAHHQNGNVDWSIVKAIVPGIVAGGVLGSLLARQFSAMALALTFSVFVYYSAAQMFLNAKAKPSRQLPASAGMFGAGTVISTLSQLVGAGGGFLSVPFMAWCNVSIHRAIGTSAAIGLPIAIVGAIGYVINGAYATGLPSGSVGYIYMPALLGVLVTSVLFAPVGARLAARLPVPTLKKVFAIFLFVLATKMLFTALK